MKRGLYIKGDLATRLAGHSSLQANGCIYWNGAVNNKGYGQMTVARKRQSTHRVAYELVHGPLKPGEQILHRCDNPRCLKVEHLFIGNPTQNSADKVAKERHAKELRLPHTKLSDQDVEVIRGLAGTNKEVAAIYGVNPSQISRIRTGARRKARAANAFVEEINP